MARRVLNFAQRFAPAVESGAKCFTIRAIRQDGKNPVVGDQLRLWTGLRSKAARLLRDVPCDVVISVMILPNQRVGNLVFPQVWLDTRLLTQPEVEVLAKSDGFESGTAFVAYFRDAYCLPFSGFLIGWSSK